MLFLNSSELIIENCNYKQMTNINYVKQLTKNTYFISAKNNIVIRENCSKQSTNLHTINTTGILKMNQNCEIILKGMKILAKSYKIREQIYEVSLANKFKKISIKNLTAIENKLNQTKTPQTIFLNSNDDFQRLMKSSDEIDQKIKS